MLNIVSLVGKVRGTPKRLNPQVVAFSLELEEEGEAPFRVGIVARRAEAAESAREGDILAISGRLRLFTYTAGTVKVRELQIYAGHVVNLSQVVEKSQIGGQ